MYKQRLQLASENTTTYPIRYHDSDSASAAMSEAYAPATVKPLSGTSLDIELYARSSESIGLISNSTSSGIVMKSVVPFEGYTTVLPLCGHVEFEMPGSSFLVSPLNGFIAECPSVRSVQLGQDSSYVSLSVNKVKLTEAYEKFSQTALRAPIVFEHGISAELTLTLRQMFSLLSSGLDSGILVDNPLAVTNLEEAFLRLLLYNQQHNYSQAIKTPSTLSLPRDVRRAMRYSDQYCNSPITVSDVARESGVGLRTLQASFAVHTDVTPYAYLRSRRLEGARQDILSGSAPSVTAAAKRWGFVSISQFSKVYVSTYGELPSQTLRGLS